MLTTQNVITPSWNLFRKSIFMGCTLVRGCLNIILNLMVNKIKQSLPIIQKITLYHLFFISRVTLWLWEWHQSFFRVSMQTTNTKDIVTFSISENFNPFYPFPNILICRQQSEWDGDGAWPGLLKSQNPTCVIHFLPQCDIS